MDPYNRNQPNYFQGLPSANNASAPYANKALGEVKNYYDPYTAYAGDPEGLLARIMGNFEQSPGQMRANQERLMAQSNTAASQGRALSPMQIKEQGDLASALTSEQMQQYIQNVLAQQQLGLGAAQGAAGDVGNIYNQQGAYAYQDQRENKNNRNAFLSSLIQALATGAGGLLGGPPGAAAGAGLSSLFSPTKTGNDYIGGIPNMFKNYSPMGNNSSWMGY